MACNGIGHFRVIDNPECVAEAVGRHKIIFRLCGSHPADYILKPVIVGESEEHRLDVGIVDLYMAHTVVLLVAACELMFFYHTIDIIVHIGSNNEAILGAAVHGLRIYIIVLGGILHKPAFLLESGEILHSLGIDLLIMLVGAGLEIDFRTDNVVERARIPFRFLAGFLGIEHIVGA